MVTDRYTYGAYGELINHIGTNTTPFLYCGQSGVMTDRNGLYYMRARYYSPEIKRFLNADSQKGFIRDSKTLNAYAYVNGNPICFIDPNGMVAWFVAAAAVGAVVGLASTFVSDLVSTIASGGETGFSSWQTYVGNTLGGAVGGVATVLTGGAAGGMIEGVTSELITQTLTILTGEDEDGDIEWEKVVWTGLTGSLFSNLDIKIKGVNVGRYSDSSIYRGVITKGRRYGTNAHMKTILRGIRANLASYAPIAEGLLNIFDFWGDVPESSSTYPALPPPPSTTPQPSYSYK